MVINETEAKDNITIIIIIAGAGGKLNTILHKNSNTQHRGRGPGA